MKATPDGQWGAVIGCLPAWIAQTKGRDFVPWWIYGALVFFVALPHSLVIKPLPVGTPVEEVPPPSRDFTTTQGAFIVGGILLAGVAVIVATS